MESIRSDLTGKSLGEYEIVERIGRGATSSIYKAFQPKLNRHVAIKVLSPFFTDERSFRERFVREAKAIAQLDHPNILPVYDFDQRDGLVYLVMRYVETGSLTEHTGKPLPMDFTLKILEQVGSALTYAHSRGIVHRDVKPGNILLGQGNWVLLTDFGLVKILKEPSSLTKPGAGVGTPDYMSPEQVRGDPVDQRADIYALGAMLYEMTTGRVPYIAESGMGVALKHINASLSPPREHYPDLSRDVERVIVKALAKDPDDRYDSVDQLVRAFKESVEHSGSTQLTTHLPSMPSEASSPPRSTARREPSTGSLVAEAWRRKSATKSKPTKVTPPSPPLPAEVIWPSKPTEYADRGGSFWALLASVIGAVVGFTTLLWALSMWLPQLVGE